MIIRLIEEWPHHTCVLFVSPGHCNQKQLYPLFKGVYGNYNANTGSSEIPREVENLATSIGLYYFTNNRDIHCLMPSLQAISKFHPTVHFCIQRWPELVMIY